MGFVLLYLLLREERVLEQVLEGGLRTRQGRRPGRNLRVDGENRQAEGDHNSSEKRLGLETPLPHTDWVLAQEQGCQGSALQPRASDSGGSKSGLRRTWPVPWSGRPEAHNTPRDPGHLELCPRE